LRKFLSIVLLFAILTPELTKAWIYIDFKINQDFIAEFLCINKDKPALKCNGNCHLAKELKKIDDKEQKELPKAVLEKSEINLFICAFTFNFDRPLNNKNNKVKFYYTNLLVTSYYSDIFHPPQLI
jgi:hypothetical protein